MEENPKHNIKDLIRWEDFLEKNTGKSNDQLLELIVVLKDPLLAYFFSYFFDYKNFITQKIILDSKNPKYCFLFAKNIQNCDVKALQKIILSSNDSNIISAFITSFTTDTDTIEFVLKNNQNIKVAFSLLHKNLISIKRVKSLIISSNNPKYLFELAKLLSSKKDINIIEDMIIDTGSARYIRLFAQNIKHANINRLENKLIDIGDMDELKKFALNIKNSKLKIFL